MFVMWMVEISMRTDTDLQIYASHEISETPNNLQFVVGIW